MAGLSPVMQEVIAAGGTAEITVTGNSMYPMLKHRVSKVKLAAAGSLKRGDLPLYRRRNGAFVLHRVIRVSDDGTVYTMCGDNQYILEHGIAKDQILAVMTEFSRDGKKWTSSNNPAYKIYVRIWLLVRLFKRLVHGVFNRLKRLFKKHKA